ALAQDKKPGVSLSFRGVVAGSPPTIYGKPRRFIPLQVIVRNDGAAEASGLLRVYRTARPPQGAGPTSIPEQNLFYERAVRVPSGGKQTQEILYYCQDREPSYHDPLDPARTSEPDRLCVSFEPASGDPVTIFPRLEMRPRGLMALSLTSA